MYLLGETEIRGSRHVQYSPFRAHFLKVGLCPHLCSVCSCLVHWETAQSWPRFCKGLLAFWDGRGEGGGKSAVVPEAGCVDLIGGKAERVLWSHLSSSLVLLWQPISW